MVISMTSFLIGTILIATAPVGQIYWAQTFLTTLITTIGRLGSITEADSGADFLYLGMDTSFPAGTLILSASLPKKEQGVAASLMTTVVNYSISLGLGFAGTIEVHTNNGGRTKADLLRGYHASYYFGIGLCVLGFVISISFLLRERLRSRNKDQVQNVGHGKE